MAAESRWPRSLEYERRVLVAGRLRPGERRIGNRWRSPTRECQLTLFPVDAATALAEAGVSCDDVKRWTESGWLSEELASAEKLDSPHLLEIAFVRDIARSGISDAQITQLLSRIKKPYWYDSGMVAYSFLYGWVQLPIFFEENEVRAFIDDFIEDWIDEKRKTDPSRLEEVQGLIVEALERVDEPDEADEEAEEE